MHKKITKYLVRTIQSNFLLLLIIVSSLLFFTPSVRADHPVLVWKGCSITKLAFMKECAEAYEKKTGTEVKLIGGGATLGIRSTIAGDADLGGTCRPCLPDIFPEVESGGYLTHVAWDAICFITHPSNPVAGITSKQAKEILTGKITNWAEVGGPDQSIILVYRRQTEQGRYSGVGYMTRKLLFQDETINYTKKALNYRDSGLVERKVEELVWSFAPDGYSSAKRRKVKILGLDGIPCDKENIKTGRYPYFRPLYLITKGKPVGEVKRFLDWIVGPEGQSIIRAQNTVNLLEGKALFEKYTAWEHSDLILNFKLTEDVGQE